MPPAPILAWQLPEKAAVEVFSGGGYVKLTADCILSLLRDVNTAVLELLIMAYALKTACARNIIGVIPYFPYSKQSKMRKRGSIVCKLLASMLAKAGECSSSRAHTSCI